MKIEILQEHLTKGLTSALRAVSSRAQLPALSHVLIEADSNGMTISATDLELSIRVKLPAKVEVPGKIAAPAKMLYEFLSSLPSGKVTLTADEGALKIASGAYRASFQTIAVEEFPPLPIPSPESVIGEIAIADFARASQAVVFASAKDSLRPALTGVLLEISKDLAMVATDGFRLAIQRVAFTPQKTLSTPLLVPARVIAEVAKTDFPEKVQMGYVVEAHQLLFFADETIIATQLLDGTFPEYGKILPSEFGSSAQIAHDELSQAVKAAHIFARDNSNMMRWKLAGSELTISAHSPERGECVIAVPINLTGEGGEIVFNAKYVLDYLGVAEADNLWFGMNNNLAPGMFRKGEKDPGLYVVMPINA